MRNLPERSKNYFLNNFTYIDKTMTLILDVMFSARRISGQLKKVKNKIFFGYCPINVNADRMRRFAFTLKRGFIYLPTLRSTKSSI